MAVDCPECAEMRARLREAEAKADRAEELAAQMLAQNHLAAKNTEVARRALIEFLDPSPGPVRILAS